MLLQRHSLRFLRRKRCFSTTTTTTVTTTSTFSNDAPLALIFDTETTDKVAFKKPYDDPCQPDLVQLGMILVDTHSWKQRMRVALLIRDAVPSPSAQAVHGISREECEAGGVSLKTACQLFQEAAAQADCLVAHNMKFDKTIMETSLHRSSCEPFTWNQVPQICTMQACTNLLQLPGLYGSYKWPTLEESYFHFTKKDIDGAHDALWDAEACLTIFRGLLEDQIVRVASRRKQRQSTPQPNELVVAEVGIQEQPESTPLHDASVVAKLGELNIVVQNEETFLVQGNTFKYKEELKQMGGKWDPSKKAWMFDCLIMLGCAYRLAGMK